VIFSKSFLPQTARSHNFTMIDHRKRLARVRTAAYLALITFAFALSAERLAADAEVRALWVVRTTLSSPSAIETMVSTARASGFNTLIVQVRGRADSYYSGGLEPRPSSLAGQPAFDPLAAVITQAHAAGLKVHAWVNLNLVAGVAELPTARDHVVYRRPDWLMVPRALAGDLLSVNPKSPQYLGRLTRYVRGRPNELEGLYVSPVTAAARAYTTDVVRDIAQRYDIDGVHLDYVRYPSEDFDYSREALAMFRQDVVRDLTAADRQKYDEHLTTEPLIYTLAFPDRWRRFREASLTTLVSQVHDAVKQAKPNATISAAVLPDAVDAATRHLQDWRGWSARSLIDVLCPMAYTTDANTFVSQVAAARLAAGGRPLWAGIGAYRLSSSQIVANVQAARRLGVDGTILFSYDSLTGPTRGPEYLSQVGRAAFIQ
jgi:uncharacterized lipoprotein YddW (UPF0748 family)